MEDKLQQLTEKKQKLDAYQPLSPEFIKNIDGWLQVELTYFSNAIEGNTLTRIETAEVIEKSMNAVINGKSLKDQLEAINHGKSLNFIKQVAKELKSHQFITEKDILDIHKIILTGIMDDWAGKYRRIEIFIRGSEAEFPLPNSIAYHIKEFIQWLEAQQEEHPVKIAADAHFKIANIHPFVDGNGRTARLFMNLILILNGYPMAVIKNEERTQYLNSFEIARKENNMQAFYDIVIIAVNR